MWLCQPIVPVGWVNKKLLLTVATVATVVTVVTTTLINEKELP
jgi:hypothetical protein